MLGFETSQTYHDDIFRNKWYEIMNALIILYVNLVIVILHVVYNFILKMFWINTFHFTDLTANGRKYLKYMEMQRNIFHLNFGSLEIPHLQVITKFICTTFLNLIIITQIE